MNKRKKKDSFFLLEKMFKEKTTRFI